MFSKLFPAKSSDAEMFDSPLVFPVIVTHF